MCKISVGLFLVLASLFAGCGSDSSEPVVLNNPDVIGGSPAELAMTGAGLCAQVDQMYDDVLAGTDSGDDGFEAFFGELPAGWDDEFSGLSSEAAFLGFVDKVDVLIAQECGYPFFAANVHLGLECMPPVGSPDAAGCVDPRVAGFDQIPPMDELLVRVQNQAVATFEEVVVEEPGGSDAGFKLNLDG